MNSITINDLRSYVRDVWEYGDNIVFDNTRDVCDDYDYKQTKTWTTKEIINYDHIRVRLNTFTWISGTYYHRTSIITKEEFKRLNHTIIIYQKVMKLMERRKRIRRLRMYMFIHLLGIDWFKEAMEKSYAPGGCGYIRLMDETLVGK